MKKKIDVKEYAGLLDEAIGKGILLNTQDQKFNSMVIGWESSDLRGLRPREPLYQRRAG